MRYLEIKRQVDDSEIAVITELLDAAARADGRRPLSDHLYLDLVNGGVSGGGFVGLVAWEPGHPHPVAYAQVSRGNESYAFELVVHPHHRYEMEAIGPELINAALDVVAREGGGAVSWWVFEPTRCHTTLAEAVSMSMDRTLLQMRRPLPTGLPVDVETRPFVVGRDETAWLDVNNRAFAGHGEQGGWTLDTFRTRCREEWFDPLGFRMYERDGRLAGFCWTKVHPAGTTDEHPLGEIYVIAVHPDFHGLGLGRQLTLAGLEHLAGRGLRNAMLYVDAANEAAVSMYQRIGFSVHSTNGAFVTNVPAASPVRPAAATE